VGAVRKFGLLAGLFVCGAARASPILILSGDDLTGAHEGNNRTGANVLVNPYGPPIWAAPSRGGRWISYDLTGVGQKSPGDSRILDEEIISPPTAVFFERFFLPDAAGSGGIWVWADDVAQVLLDGVRVFPFPRPPVRDMHCIVGSIGCQPGEEGFIDLSGLSGGEHTLEFRVHQLWGDTYGLMYEGSVEPIPEPATFLLIATGAAWAAARANQRHLVRRATGGSKTEKAS